jgi:endonuclease/exonuclease/phosphatase family metal-dependent hydrolase
LSLVLAGAAGFNDVYDQCCPNSLGFTYSRKNPYVDPTSTVDQRIDYIFASNELVASDCSVVFDGSRGLGFVSDHFGVFCSLAFRGNRVG